jgi:hypothetical protein
MAGLQGIAQEPAMTLHQPIPSRPHVPTPDAPPRNALSHLRRPTLLIRAARAGLPLYRRKRDLRRLLGADPAPAPAAALTALLEAEACHEARRAQSDGTYDPAGHVAVMIALLGEARLLSDTSQADAVATAAAAGTTKARDGVRHNRGAA